MLPIFIGQHAICSIDLKALKEVGFGGGKQTMIVMCSLLC